MLDDFAEPTKSRPAVAPGQRNRRTALLTISAALFAIAPKCPICFLAYFGVFGVAASSASAYRAWLPPITGFWLALTIAMLAFQRRGKPRYGPAVLGSIAALLLMGGKFVFDSQLMTFAGVVTLFAAAIWRARIQQRISIQACAQCEELPLLHDKS